MDAKGTRELVLDTAWAVRDEGSEARVVFAFDEEDLRVVVLIITGDSHRLFDHESAKVST